MCNPATRMQLTAWLLASALVMTACPGDDPTPGADADVEVSPPDVADGGDSTDTADAEPDTPDADAEPDTPDADADVPPDEDADADVPPDEDAVDAGDGDVAPDMDAVEPDCGNGVQEGDEECDDGEANSDTEPDACRTDCTEPTCGDEVTDTGEECDDGNDNDFDGCTGNCEVAEVVPVPSEGDVVITELMINPMAVADPLGEWIELTNTTGDELTLGPCILHDDGTDVVPLTDGEGAALVLPAGAVVVLGYEADPALNGGVTVDFPYTTMLLDNVADEVVLTCGEMVVDTVAWNNVTWPLEHGKAISLDPNAADNGVSFAWCASDQAFGDGDFGTPGELNPVCPPPDVTVDVCTVTTAADVTGFVDVPTTIDLVIAEPGITDVSDEVDAYPDLIVEVGSGPDGSDPAAGGWTWEAAAPVEGWEDAGGNDGYSGAFTVSTEGQLDAGARVSKDAGATWVYCDRDPAAQAWDPAEAVQVTVVANPCEPNPCDAPPADECAADQVTILSYPTAGACTPTAAGAFDCAYEPLGISCATEGKLCEAGACGALVPGPTAEGQVVFSELMVTPTVEDFQGEWFELANPSDEPVSLEGCELTDGDEDDHVIAEPLVIPPGRVVVLGRTANPVLNGGVDVDYVVGDDIVLDKTDSLTLTCGELAMDTLDWTVGWPHATGVAMSLSPYELDAAANDVMSAWCPGLESYGIGGLGTPGSVNPACPGDEIPVTECQLVGPKIFTGPAGANATFEVLVHVAGVTDDDPGPNPDPGVILVRAWIGPDGTEPGGDGWTSTPGAIVIDWDAEAAGVDPKWDAYEASPRLPAPGGWDLAFEASADGGNTYTACDLDGSDNGYDPDESVLLTSEASPCYPDPCGAQPAMVCDGPVVGTPTGPATCAVEDTTAICAWPNEPVEDCSVFGADCVDGACANFPVNPVAGEMLFSELAIIPTSGALGEWIELFNWTDSVLTLEGCELTSAPSESWAWGEDGVLVWPGQTLLLARSVTPGIGGGVPADVVYSGVALENSGDTVSLVCGAEVVDSVTYDATWPLPVGGTTALSGAWMVGGDNDDVAKWCAGKTGTPAGTPGTLNPLCPPVDDVVDACVFVGPTPQTITANETAVVLGRLFDAGTTDATTGVDAAPGIVSEFGFGPHGVDPSDPSWTWFPGVPDDEWVDAGQPDYDQWRGEITTDAAGSWDVAVRFSVDDGQTWQACDLDGSGNGYDPDQSGDLVVEPLPCSPNPCTAPPAPSCDGDDISVAYGPGTCTDDGAGGFTCDYPRETFDCGPYGGCVAAACADLVSPTTSGSLVVTEILADSVDPDPDDGEWFEVTNMTSTPLDLRGCTVADGGASHMVSGDLPIVVDAGGYFVFGASADTAINGGLTPDYVYEDVVLGNILDSVTITCGGTMIDTVSYGVGWPFSTGVAMQLGNNYTSASANNNVIRWCEATSTYGDGDNAGSPGVANDDCP